MESVKSEGRSIRRPIKQTSLAVSAGRRRYRDSHLPIPVGDKHFDVT